MVNLERRQLITGGLVGLALSLIGVSRGGRKQSEFEKAVENYRDRYDYVKEEFDRKKPDNVEKVAYDHYRVSTIAAAKRFAQLTAEQYYQNFNSPKAREEVASILSDYSLFKDKSHEETVKGINNFIGYNQGRLTLRDMIEEHLNTKLFNKIMNSSAVLLEILRRYGERPKYNAVIFPEAFETKPGEVPQTERGLKTNVEALYLKARGMY